MSFHMPSYYLFAATLMSSVDNKQFNFRVVEKLSKCKT